ncbi:VOC family protein [Actinocorallia lasiicapitis]
MQKITTFLWFDGKAEEAAEFYTTLFDDSKILDVQPWADGGPYPSGTAMVVEFQLAGQRYQALNGGSNFTFNEAISLLVDCDDQAEVDRLWDALTADGGEESQCGWLKDRYGLSWQIVPRALQSCLAGPDREGAARAMQAMLGMRKLDVAALEAAYKG